MRKIIVFISLIYGLFNTAYAREIPENVLSPRKGLPNFLEKVQNNHPVTVVYFGGSITEAGHGYRVQSEKWFRETYPGVSFTMINAAIGGTGSDLGVIRIDDDVLKYEPDLVFVEFAVNDGGGDSLTIIRSMEGIVRKIWKHDLSTDICFLYTTAENQMLYNLEGKHWKSARIMEQVAGYYNIPSVSMNFSVAKLAIEDKLVVRGDKDKNYGNRIVFTNDGVHPTTEGHQIYTRSIIDAFRKMPDKNYGRTLPSKPMNADNYEYSGMYPVKQGAMWGNWISLGQGNEIYDRFRSRLPELICGKTNNEMITVKFKGRRIGFYDVIGPGTGKITVRIDDRPPFTIQRFDRYCTYYRSHYFWLPELEDREHIVHISVDPSPINKEDILSGSLTDEIRKELTKSDIYLGKILLIGELLPMEKDSHPPYPYPQEPEVMKNLREWLDLKFGLFMHWGAYSQWGIVESWTLCPEDYPFTKRPAGSTYFEYVKEYKGLIKTFNLFINQQV
jgi:lysophospholipase L1-like esterase